MSLNLSSSSLIVNLSFLKVFSSIFPLYINIGDVDYAILETSGQVTVIPKPNKRNTTPEDFNIEPEYEGISYDLVVDGKVMYKNLEKIGKNYKWLERQSEKFGIKPEEALIITIDGNNNFFCQPLQNKN